MQRWVLAAATSTLAALVLVPVVHSQEGSASGTGWSGTDHVDIEVHGTTATLRWVLTDGRVGTSAVVYAARGHPGTWEEPSREGESNRHSVVLRRLIPHAEYEAQVFSYDNEEDQEGISDGHSFSTGSRWDPRGQLDLVASGVAALAVAAAFVARRRAA